MEYTKVKTKSNAAKIAAGLLTILSSIIPQTAISDVATDQRPRELTDLELDSVTAGNQSVSPLDDLMAFSASKTTAAGTRIHVDGSFGLVDSLDSKVVGSLALSGNAQRDLSSLININAVNSTINVLMNLNINIDSNIGQLNQYNLQGILPNQLTLPRQ